MPLNRQRLILVPRLRFLLIGCWKIRKRSQNLWKDGKRIISTEHYVVNIRKYFNHAQSENDLRTLLSEFSCPQNPQVEYFLRHHAIEFTKKDQSVTYLAFNFPDGSLAGYFSLAIKPISVLAANISKTTAKKLSRTSIVDQNSKSYVTSAYLIAQLGKNYSLPKENQISGSVLLELALDTISTLQYSTGGVMEFLECEDNPFLLQFYKENLFIPFDQRLTSPVSGKEPHILHQLLKFI